MTNRCPDCGRNVPSFFQHVDVDCMSEAFSLGWESYHAGEGLFRAMKRHSGDAQTRFIEGWQAVDEAKGSA